VGAGGKFPYSQRVTIKRLWGRGGEAHEPQGGGVGKKEKRKKGEWGGCGVGGPEIAVAIYSRTDAKKPGGGGPGGGEDRRSASKKQGSVNHC